MPIYKEHEGELVPFRRLHPGAELYEQEIETLVWRDLEAFTGESLFPLARQPRIPGGGIPDILALDASGNVVVIEIKRDVDRNQLAQCLEYAGWARLTSLDEVAGLYDAGDGAHQGVAAFFRDWQDFTESSTPVTIHAQPRLFLIARDFHGRTQSALDFLRENAVPVTVVPVTIYEDDAGQRIIDIESDHEPPIALGAPTLGPKTSLIVRRTVSIQDLLDANLIQTNEEVEFVRPRIGKSHRATILADGQFKLVDGTICRSPSRAAMKAANVASYDGWYAWRMPRLGGTKLYELRERLNEMSETS